VLVVLQAERVPALDVKNLADVAIRFGPNQFVSPRFRDPPSTLNRITHRHRPQ